MKRIYVSALVFSLAILNCFGECRTVGEYGLRGTFANKITITNCVFLSCGLFKDYACYGSFSNCTGLVKFRANACTNIGQYAFARAFNGCSDLKIVEFNNLEKARDHSFDGAFSGGCRQLVLNFPELREIGAAAFAGCTSVTSLTATACTSVYDEGSADMNGSFYGCTGLKYLNLSSASSLRYNEFDTCTALTNVVIGIASNSLHTCAAYPWGLAPGTTVQCLNNISFRVPIANWEVYSKSAGVEIAGAFSYTGDSTTPQFWYVPATYNGNNYSFLAYTTFYLSSDITLTCDQLPEMEIKARRVW